MKIIFVIDDVSSANGPLVSCSSIPLADIELRYLFDKLLKVFLSSTFIVYQCDIMVITYHPSVHLSIFLYVCCLTCVVVCSSVCRSICLPVHLPVCPFVHPSMSVWLSICRSVCPLYVYLSVQPPI